MREEDIPGWAWIRLQPVQEERRQTLSGGLDQCHTAIALWLSNQGWVPHLRADSKCLLCEMSFFFFYWFSRVHVVAVVHFCLLQAAFHAVMNLWNKKPLKVYGSRMSESLLAILSHIIRGEGIIKVRTEQPPGIAVALVCKADSALPTRQVQIVLLLL